MSLLLALLAVAAVCLVFALGLWAEQARFERQLPPPTVRPARVIPPPLPGPPAWGHADHLHTRPPTSGGPGRHRAPGGDT